MILRQGISLLAVARWQPPPPRTAQTGSVYHVSVALQTETHPPLILYPRACLAIPFRPLLPHFTPYPACFSRHPSTCLPRLLGLQLCKPSPAWFSSLFFKQILPIYLFSLGSGVLLSPQSSCRVPGVCLILCSIHSRGLSFCFASFLCRRGGSGVRRRWGSSVLSFQYCV